MPIVGLLTGGVGFWAEESLELSCELSAVSVAFLSASELSDKKLNLERRTEPEILYLRIEKENKKSRSGQEIFEIMINRFGGEKIQFADHNFLENIRHNSIMLK